MDDLTKTIEKRLSDGCPAEIKNHLIQAQNHLVQAREASIKRNRQMTEAACSVALDSIRHALNLCGNGS